MDELIHSGAYQSLDGGESGALFAFATGAAHLDEPKATPVMTVSAVATLAMVESSTVPL